VQSCDGENKPILHVRVGLKCKAWGWAVAERSRVGSRGKLSWDKDGETLKQVTEALPWEGFEKHRRGALPMALCWARRWWRCPQAISSNLAHFQFYLVPSSRPQHCYLWICPRGLQPQSIAQSQGRLLVFSLSPSSNFGVDPQIQW